MCCVALGCCKLRVNCIYCPCEILAMLSHIAFSIDVSRYPCPDNTDAATIQYLCTFITFVYVYRLNSGFSHCVELVPILSTNLDDRKHRLMKHCAASIARQS